MVNDNISTSVVPLANRPISRKPRAHSPTLSTGKNLTCDCYINRISTGTNQSSLSKLPNLISKTSSTHTLTSDPMQLKRYRSQQQKDLFNSSSSKFERQSTNINSQTRLPTLYTLISDNDQKRISEFRRRQIYALNHLMRELEQEQFRQFRKLHSIDTNNHENMENSNEDANKNSLT
ncbi:unnamed protein product [Rotaria sordida]|uniref:Uncharacterized protein n=1 Tax=Rotaria sordida TaxID=392033 RepID=A0A819T164_9BILA|nr:unnamed protein product [Rotaria sordida]CAF1185484.1 unnamed protein product [Rotaria sordida]CAF4059180.1 unnamed protein product [Rotaria sordida]CAF4077381.1 unnamed protein product [Rotaria sordida]